MPNSKNKRKAGQDAPGKALEKAVARIQQRLDPASTVTHDEVLVDRVGNKRQFDVVVRGKFAGRDILGVIECKDHAKKKGPDAVEAFAKKSENVGANLRFMVSRRGFTPQALTLAKHEGIGCLSLLPDPGASVGFSIGHYAYAVQKTWTGLRVAMSPLPHVDYLVGVSPADILVDGKMVVRWFERELITKHQAEIENREYTLTVQFDPTIEVQCKGETIRVNEIWGLATRVVKLKRMWVSISGDGLYDSHQGAFTAPSGATLSTSYLDTDFSTWPDYDGPLPDAVGREGSNASFIQITLIRQQSWNPADDVFVPDLVRDEPAVAADEEK